MRILLLSLFLSMAAFDCFATNQIEQFTFQGRLQANGQPANGTFPMTFALFDAATLGNQVGSTVSKGSVNVNDGAFSVNLSYPAAFAGAQLYLETTVNGQTLSPRQAITATPVAQYSLNAANGAQALFYVNHSPDDDVNPPFTTLTILGPLTLYASCTVNAGSGAVKVSIYAYGTSNFDVHETVDYRSNDTGALGIAPLDVSGGNDLTIVGFTVNPNNFTRAHANIVLHSLDASDAIVTAQVYLSVDARAASGCFVYGTAILGFF